MTVEIAPMPQSIREIAERWRPAPPPIFPHGAPSDADRALALDLWRALDPDSRRWYWRSGACAGLDLTQRDLAGLKTRSRTKRSRADA